MFRSQKWWMVFVFIVVLSSISAFAQNPTGQISGVVTDPNGAVVSGANVKITDQATNLERETTTGSDGEFAFQTLPPGNYQVVVTMSGFAVYTANTVVNITQTTTLNPQLSVQGTGTIEVTVTAPLVQTETSQNGRVVTGETIRQLPLPTRNFQQLLTLSSGAQSSVSNNTELGRGDATISVNGQRTTSNSVRINGIDANSIGTNSTPNIAVPATDSLQEFIVQTSLYDASNGRNAGGNVEAVTRSGSNDYHGNVYYFLRDDALNANDTFVKRRGLPRSVLTRNQFGGTLGGRIVRDRVFFFGSYQGTRERNGASLTNSLTFPAVPAGLTDNNRNAAALAAAFSTPGSPLTAAQINPVSLAILNAKLPNGQFAIPSSGVSGAAGSAAITGVQLVQSGESRFRENQFNANLDFNFSNKHSLAVKTFYADNPTFQANYSFAGVGNGQNQLVGFGADLKIQQKLYTIADTYIFSSNVVNQARIGYSRIRVTSVPQEPFTAASLGISSPLASIYSGAPTLSFGGTDSNFTFGSSPLADQSSRINAYTFNDTLSWTAGDHRLKFGVEARRSTVKFYFNAFSRGQILYNNTVGATGTTTAFQNFLQGNGTSLIGSGVYDRSLRVNDFSGFVQDDWKINSRLTLNLGVRYDLFGLPVDTDGRLVNVLLSQLRVGTTASPAAPPNGFVQAEGGTLAGVPTVAETLVPKDKNNFAPRIGFAYQIAERNSLTLRGGYGIYYDRISTRFANTQLFNYPYFAIGVGLVNPTFAPILPGTFRPATNPFVPIPAPSSFPTAATIPSPLSALSPAGFPVAGVFVDPGLVTPYVQQYNLGVQGTFAKNYLWEVGYVGNKGTNLLQVISPNQPVYNPATNSFAAPLAAGGIISTNKNLTGGVQQVQTTSLSHYNSLQASVTRRFSDGLQFLAAYTYGKSYDYYSGGAVNELANTPGDQYNWRTNYGRSDFNREHRFVVSGVYELPKVVGDDSGAKWFLNNWQVAGVAVFQSGLPFSIIDNPGNAVISRANFNPAQSSNLQCRGSVASCLTNYFNQGAFVSSKPRLDNASVGIVTNTLYFDPNNPFGNTPRNFLTGPGQKNVDISFIKLIPFNDRFRGEFRTEFFNVFNWVNYANPGNNIAVPANFGIITSASSGPRVIQFAFKLGF